MNRQGGVCTIVNGKWAPYVENPGTDSLGRWTINTIKGQGTQRVTIITTYRSMEGSITSNSGTIWRQQYDLLNNSLMDQDDSTLQTVNPRKQMLIYMTSLIQVLQEERHKVVLLIDANETRRGLKIGTYGNMVEDL